MIYEEIRQLQYAALQRDGNLFPNVGLFPANIMVERLGNENRAHSEIDYVFGTILAAPYTVWRLGDIRLVHNIPGLPIGRHC